MLTIHSLNKIVHTTSQAETQLALIELTKTAFLHNCLQYRQIIGLERKLAVVVKSNAYGHGIKAIAQWCQELNTVDMLCTATLSEALFLRSQNITKPILVLYYIDADVQLAALHDIALMVDSEHVLHQLNQIACTLQKKITVHIKIDTGMNRFGFCPKTFLTVAAQLHLYPGIRFEGIYTHFAESDSCDTSYTIYQQHLFSELCNQLPSALFAYRHSAKTGAVSTIDLENTNLVRIGAGAYGLWPSRAVHQLTLKKYPWFSLDPVLSLKTHIMQIKTVPAHTPIGYSRTFVTTRETRLGFLPIGYYHGYQRRCANKASVLVAHQNMQMHAPVIGAISMNGMCIDITHIPFAQKGTEVTLVGSEQQITALYIAEQIESNNPREITTALHESITRRCL